MIRELWQPFEPLPLRGAGHALQGNFHFSSGGMQPI
jgi:hypothetical protein